MTTSPPTGPDSSSSRQAPASERYYGADPSDEISLVDLAKVLWKRRWWMLAIAVTTVGLALAFALQQEQAYRYTTTLLLGETEVGERVSSGAAVQEVVERRFLPALRASFVEERELERLPFDVAVERDGDAANLVVLQSETVLAHEDLVRALHAALGAAIVAEHDETIRLVSRQTEIELENLGVRLELQKRRLDGLTALADEAATLGVDADSEPERVQDLSLGAHYTIPEGRSFQPTLSSQDPQLAVLLSRLQLMERMSEYERIISELMAAIGNAELKRDWIRPTRIAVDTMRSEGPVGTGKSLIVALGVVLAAMFALFGAFLIEFGAQVRQSLTQGRLSEEE